MSEREKMPKKGPEPGEEFKADTEHGYLEGYEGREHDEEADRPADFSDPGDWGRQGEWGTFSNRPGRRRNQNWPEMGDLGSEVGKADDPPKKK